MPKIELIQGDCGVSKLVDRCHVVWLINPNAWRILEKVGEFQGKPLFIQWPGLYTTFKAAWGEVRKVQWINEAHQQSVKDGFASCLNQEGC